jgi:phosphinothricin acetyltransferase
MPPPQPEGDPGVVIRPATVDDLGVINDIYNHYVLHSTATYQEDPEPMEGRRAWFERHGPSHPMTVAETGGRVVGWGSLSPFHARSAYRMTVENSVYLRPDHHGRGIGTLLLRDLIGRARSLGHHTILAIIDAEQPASVALHAKLGFVRVALLREVGHKFGRWRDVVYMQLVL